MGPEFGNWVMYGLDFVILWSQSQGEQTEHYLNSGSKEKRTRFTGKKLAGG